MLEGRGCSHFVMQWNSSMSSLSERFFIHLLVYYHISWCIQVITLLILMALVFLCLLSCVWYMTMNNMYRSFDDLASVNTPVKYKLMGMCTQHKTCNTRLLRIIYYKFWGFHQSEYKTIVLTINEPCDFVSFQRPFRMTSSSIHKRYAMDVRETKKETWRTFWSALCLLMA